MPLPEVMWLYVTTDDRGKCEVNGTLLPIRLPLLVGVIPAGSEPEVVGVYPQPGTISLYDGAYVGRDLPETEDPKGAGEGLGTSTLGVVDGSDLLHRVHGGIVSEPEVRVGHPVYDQQDVAHTFRSMIR